MGAQEIVHHHEWKLVVNSFVLLSISICFFLCVWMLYLKVARAISTTTVTKLSNATKKWACEQHSCTGERQYTYVRITAWPCFSRKKMSSLSCKRYNSRTYCPCALRNDVNQCSITDLHALCNATHIFFLSKKDTCKVFWALLTKSTSPQV